MIKTAILVNKAEDLVNTIPMLGFVIDIVEVLIADPDPIKISVIINNFFSYSMVYISYNSHYQL